MYQETPFTDDMIQDYTGFVYSITCLESNRIYIGQKNFYSSRTKTIKGKKKKIKVISDYQDYYGSNEELKELVSQRPKSTFKREILYLCKNKGTQNYLELREQVDRRVLESDLYFNSFVGGKIHKKHVKL
jgi:hypothetical protein